VSPRSVSIKRGFDLIAAAIGLIVLAPAIGLTALLILFRLGRPVLFRQQRPGLGGRLFQNLKFRSMDNARDASGQLLSDARRISGFGAFLRRTSLDELPELWNVLRGDMSIVGPRPLLPEYLPLYDSRQTRRHDVRPGLTGWAQINGRNELTWEQRLEFDVWYVEHWSFRLDLRIILLTVAYVLRGQGISYPGEATMKPFHGGPDQ